MEFTYEELISIIAEFRMLEAATKFVLEELENPGRMYVTRTFLTRPDELLDELFDLGYIVAVSYNNNYCTLHIYKD